VPGALRCRPRSDKNNGLRVSTPPLLAWLRRRLTLDPNDLLRDAAYRRIFGSILVGSFGTQMSMLALPLAAAVLLAATPTQMGLLAALEALPFALFSLPTGVYLDRWRKLPVYVAGESALALAMASVTLAWWMDWLTMGWLYVVGFTLGVVNTVSGSAAQIVLTQIVPRERLIEAHARNGLANSAAEVAGPGAAGALIRLLGAPLTLLLNSALLAASALILAGLRIREAPRATSEAFWPSLRTGMRFVATHRLLLTMAIAVGVWHMCYFAANVVQILFATRTLGLTEGGVGLAYTMVGVGTVAASLLGHRISRWIGPGPAMVAGFTLNGAGWLLAAAAPVGTMGVAMFALMLMLLGAGAILIFVNFLALRQAVTPTPLLGRMTSTMRWLIMVPSVPGALLGGWLGEHLGLRAAMAFAGACALLLAWVAWRLPVFRDTRVLPVHRDIETPGFAGSGTTHEAA
jgi:MFS family permease